MTLMNNATQHVTDELWKKVSLSRKALAYSSLNSRITMQIFLLHDPVEIEHLLKQRAENTEAISELIKQIDDMRLSSGARFRDLQGHDNDQTIPINRLLRLHQTRD